MIRPPILTYLGHVLAHLSHEDQAWDTVTNQLCHNLAEYKTLPLNSFEKVAIINAVLIPCWTYRGLFLGDKQRMAQWDNILLQNLWNTPRVEPRMNRHRITTDLRDRGMGLRKAWWSFITRWVTLGQKETRQTGQTATGGCLPPNISTWTRASSSCAPGYTDRTRTGYSTRRARRRTPNSKPEDYGLQPMGCPTTA